MTAGASGNILASAAFFAITDANGFVTDISRNFKQLLGVRRSLGVLPERIRIGDLNHKLAPEVLEAEQPLQSVFLVVELSTRAVGEMLRAHPEFASKSYAVALERYEMKVRVVKAVTSKNLEYFTYIFELVSDGETSEILPI